MRCGFCLDELVVCVLCLCKCSYLYKHESFPQLKYHLKIGDYFFYGLQSGYLMADTLVAKLLYGPPNGMGHRSSDLQLVLHFQGKEYP